VCPLSGLCFSGVVKDYLEGTFKGSQAEKVAMQTETLLEAANFQKRLGWFETDIAAGAAPSKSDFDFWTVASKFAGAKNVPPNGFDDILNEVCEETGLVSDVSDEEAW
jgi:hypothetical protein